MWRGTASKASVWGCARSAACPKGRAIWRRSPNDDRRDAGAIPAEHRQYRRRARLPARRALQDHQGGRPLQGDRGAAACRSGARGTPDRAAAPARARSEEHTSELQSLMRISYAVFCLKKKKRNMNKKKNITQNNKKSRTINNRNNQ